MSSDRHYKKHQRHCLLAFVLQFFRIFPDVQKVKPGFLRRSSAKSTAKHFDFSVYHTFYNLFRQAASSLPSSAYKSMAITQRITIDISTQSSLNTWEP